jgi:hypothetical protein
VTLREEYRVRVFENRVLRRILCRKEFGRDGGGSDRMLEEITR